MIDIDLLKKTFKYRVNNNQQGDLSLEGFNNLAYLSSMMLFNKYLGLEEQYSPQTKGAIIEYPATKKIHTELIPFKRVAQLPITIGTSYVQIPNDLYYILNIRSYYYADRRDSNRNRRLKSCGCSEDKDESTDRNKMGGQYARYTKDIKYVSEDKWSNRVSSVLIKSDSYCPYSDIIEFDFKKFVPSFVRIEYLSYPQMPKWGYIINNGIPVYDTSKSTHLEWNLSQIDRITERMDNLFSRNISDGFGTNFSQSKIIRGE